MSSYKHALYKAMHNALSEHDNTIIIGQGVTDHKGIFGSTLGLAEEFGKDRLIDTPLAEDSITGICIGAALNGLYPINTHIRADFSLLAFNQLINHAAKYKYMFGGLFNVPMMVRLVVGRSWGQGAQHSQSPQSLFAHIPGLMVIMPSSPYAIVNSYRHAISNHNGPLISIEHRLLYDLEFNDEGWNTISGNTPFSTRLVREGKDITIVATSIMVLECMRAAEYLSSHGIDCEVIDLQCISHPDHEMIIDSVSKTKHLLVADTSWTPYGVAAEVGRILIENDPSILSKPMISLGMQPSPCPTAKSLEDIFYPTIGDICNNVIQLITNSKSNKIQLPTERSMSDFYKSFKGPF